MSFRLRIAFALAITLAASLCYSQDFKKQVIYQIVTDRFFNGSTANDNPSQSSGLFDSTMTNWQAYWGRRSRRHSGQDGVSERHGRDRDLDFSHGRQ